MMAANVHRSPEHQRTTGKENGDYQLQKPQPHAGQKQQKQNHRTGQGQALAAAAKPAPKLVCYVWDEEGHRGPACPELKKVKRLVKERGQPHNAAVTSTDPPADAANQDADGGLWLAASDRTAVTKEWILDPGATHHLCTNKNMLFGVEPVSLKIKVANSDTITANLKGNCLLWTNVNGVDRTVLLTEGHYCENLGRNLLSLSQLRRRGPRFTFDEKCTFHGSDSSIVGEAIERRSLWVVNASAADVNSDEPHACFANIPQSSLQQWHERLGHVNYQDLLKIVNKNLATGMAIST
ncbi:unnamed protein product [Phytophthora fragariaefolia]|uniref:Unnamed protein product n=1 Tax=Phytophthora fragariaefolia TaxID=1490495 RepID=A0A9W6XT75_9STRA|nr:unnamed protein product [Phytophthora fragariaefolia]